MAVTAKYEGGRLVGYTCGYGHTHTGQAASTGRAGISGQEEAIQCEKDPTAYTEEENKRKKELEAQRESDIRNDPSFEQAVDAVQELGAKNDEDAEAVVIRVGIQPVLNARDAVRALKIPVAKKPAAPAPPKA
jgi:hypothetical protein